MHSASPTQTHMRRTVFLVGGPVNWPLNECVNVNDIRGIQLTVLTSVVIYNLRPYAPAGAKKEGEGEVVKI